MLVAHWMVQPVLTVPQLAPVAHARTLMEDHGIRHLPVVHRDRLVGIVTDRDLRDAFPSVVEGVRRTPPEVRDQEVQLRVSGVMTHRVTTVEADDEIAKAATLMLDRHIGAVVVVAHGRVKGILTRSDVLRAFAVLTQLTARKSRFPMRAPQLDDELALAAAAMER